MLNVLVTMPFGAHAMATIRGAAPEVAVRREDAELTRPGCC